LWSLLFHCDPVIFPPWSLQRFAGYCRCFSLKILPVVVSLPDIVLLGFPSRAPKQILQPSLTFPPPWTTILKLSGSVSFSSSSPVLVGGTQPHRISTTCMALDVLSCALPFHTSTISPGLAHFPCLPCSVSIKSSSISLSKAPGGISHRLKCVARCCTRPDGPVYRWPRRYETAFLFLFRLFRFGVPGDGAGEHASIGFFLWGVLLLLY